MNHVIVALAFAAMAAGAYALAFGGFFLVWGEAPVSLPPVWLVGALGAALGLAASLLEP